MKKIFAVLMCALMLMCALPIVSFAETDTTETDIVETVPSEAPVEVTTVDKVVEYIQLHLEEISVIVTLIGYVFYQARKHKLLNKSIGTLNNNAVAVAENSKESINSALATMNDIEQTLADVKRSLHTAKLANMELANEVAELLVLANIPNSKKEELYARHLAAVGAIADAEKTEVITDDNGNEEK